MSIPAYGVEPQEEKGLLDFFKWLAGLFYKPEVEKDRISLFGLPVIEAGEPTTSELSAGDRAILEEIQSRYPNLALIKPEAAPLLGGLGGILGGVTEAVGTIGESFPRIMSFLETMAPLLFMSLLLQLGNMSMLQDRLSRQVDED